VINCSVALLLGLTLLILSPLIAGYWVQPQTLSVAAISQSFMIMSVSFTFQWMSNLYLSGLASLQKQVLTNSLNIIFTTLRSVGAFLVIAFYSQTIQAFLGWQALVAGLQTVVFLIFLRRSLPVASSAARFRKKIIKKVWRFAGGMTGIAIVSLILMQSDKVILSRILTLEFFGYYTLAITISSLALNQIATTIDNAIYPKFLQLVASGEETSLRQLYHLGCQAMSTLIIPTAVILAFFSFQILSIWTRNEIITLNTYVLLSIIAVATGFHCLMWLPYRLQLAHGWTTLSFYKNVVAIFLIVPMMIYGVINYGAIGGAVSLLILYINYTLIPLQIMHRRLLKGELKNWYLKDVGLPLAATLGVATISILLFPKFASPTLNLLWIAATWGCAVLLSSLIAPQLRDKILQIVKYKIFAAEEKLV